MSKLLKMQQLEDEDELAYSAEDTSRINSDSETYEDGRPSWMKTLHNSASTWLQLLPQSLQVSFEAVWIGALFVGSFERMTEVYFVVARECNA